MRFIWVEDGFRMIGLDFLKLTTVHEYGYSDHFVLLSITVVGVSIGIKFLHSKKGQYSER